MRSPLFLPTTSIRQKSLESPVPFYHANMPLEKKINYKNGRKKLKNAQTRRHTELKHCKLCNSTEYKAKKTSPDQPHSQFTEEIPHQEDIILDISNHLQIYLNLANLNFACFKLILNCSSELEHKQQQLGCFTKGV